MALAARCLGFCRTFKYSSGLCIKSNLSYKSAVSLENIYPNSRLSIYTPSQAPEPSENEKFNGFIPIDQLHITYSRSSGPGGQNVNTVSTKVDLRLHLESASWLHADIRKKMLEQHKTRITKDGFLVIRSDKTRSQQLNLADAMSRLREMIWIASAPPPPGPSPETEEKIRRRRERQARERLLQKRLHSITKQDRQAPTFDS